MSCLHWLATFLVEVCDVSTSQAIKSNNAYTFASLILIGTYYGNVKV